jgi:hypothetical protein
MAVIPLGASCRAALQSHEEVNIMNAHADRPIADVYARSEHA